MLTIEEIEALWIDPGKGRSTWFARAIESAVLSKLAAGVSVETPYIYTEWISPGERVSRDMFNSDQIQTAIAAARVQAINECADILAEYDCLNSGMGRDIRALIGGST